MGLFGTSLGSRQLPSGLPWPKSFDMDDLDLTDAEAADVLADRASDIIYAMEMHELCPVLFVDGLERKEYKDLRRIVKAYRKTMAKTDKLMEIIDAHEKLDCPCKEPEEKTISLDDWARLNHLK